MAESVEAKLDRILAMQEEFLAELRFLGLAAAPSPPPPTKESPVVVQDAPPHPIDAKPLVVDAVPDAQIHPAVAVPDAETHPVAGPDAEIHPIATVDPTTRRLIDETRAVIRAEFDKMKISMRERFAKLEQVTAAPSSHLDDSHTTTHIGLSSAAWNLSRAPPLRGPSTFPTREVLVPIFTEKNVPTSLDTRCSRLSHQRSSNTSFGVEGTTSKESTLDHTLAAATPSVINVKPVTDEVVPALLVENKACEKRLSAPTEGAPANCLMKCPDSFTLPVAVYTIDKEPSTNPTSATATPTLFVEPNSYNSGAPFSCSSICQGHADIVFDPGIPTTDPKVDSNMQLAPPKFKSISHVTDGLQVFDEIPKGDWRLLKCVMAVSHAAKVFDFWGNVCWKIPWPPPLIGEVQQSCSYGDSFFSATTNVGSIATMDIQWQRLPWPHFIVSDVLEGGFKRFVLLSNRAPSQCLKLCLELLGSSSFDHVLSSVYLLIVPPRPCRSTYQLHLSRVKISQVHTAMFSISNASIREGYQLLVLLDDNFGEKATGWLKPLACAHCLIQGFSDKATVISVLCSVQKTWICHIAAALVLTTTTKEYRTRMLFQSWDVVMASCKVNKVKELSIIASMAQLKCKQHGAATNVGCVVAELHVLVGIVSGVIQKYIQSNRSMALLLVGFTWLLPKHKFVLFNELIKVTLQPSPIDIDVGIAIKLRPSPIDMLRPMPWPNFLMLGVC